MKIVKALCAVAAAGLIASAASAQTVNHETTTTKTVTKVHVTHASTSGMHHGRRLAYGHHRTCHMVWRHHHHVRVCRAMPMHIVRHTTVKTKVITH